MHGTYRRTFKAAVESDGMPRCHYTTPPRLEAVPGFEPGSARPIAAAGRSGVSAVDASAWSKNLMPRHR
jgi:hypothetical protein